MSLADWTRLFLLSLLWGSAFFLIEIALTEAGPLMIVMTRVSLAALALLIYCAPLGIRFRLDLHRLGTFAILGFIAIAVPFSVIALGQPKINSSLTAILIATTPFFTLIVAHLWGRAETATPNKVMGVLAGLAGVIVLMGPNTLAGLGGN
jgi:drug/metabolite transporter (DMT)-like permease